MAVLNKRAARRASLFVLVLLAVEFIDEFVYGAGQAALPLIRDDFALDYAQIGLLLSAPGIIGSLAELSFGILGDGKHRRLIILGGGVVFVFSLLLTAISGSFLVLLVSYMLFNPASGAFVSLSQATLMDVDPSRHEQNMARWTFAGALGVFAGPLALGAVVALGGGWREVHLILAIVALFVLIVASRHRFPRSSDAEPVESFRAGLREAFGLLRKGSVLRWLTLLQFSDLMLDVLYGYLALYFVDVVGAGESGAGIAVLTWTGIGLLGDFLVIPLLERVRGLTYLRFSAAIVAILFPAFLIVPGFGAKLVILGLLGVFNAGWYSVLQGQMYTAMPGRSGMTLTVGNLFGLVGAIVPFTIGLAADTFGLGAAMWLLLLGPIALLIGLPRRGGDRQDG
jgi:FSR family fosmidomycin resistance protein-like MFS transporter